MFQISSESNVKFCFGSNCYQTLCNSTLPKLNLERKRLQEYRKRCNNLAISFLVLYEVDFPALLSPMNMYHFVNMDNVP